ncbi:ABC-type transport auxiliary lipoprotein family protein [Sulfitobacter sp. JB4-11]|uniref:ABC-type transport auxiliary lipoprotein family protein n=1 Tax=Sulfitobacter rhodophyticola TaxID=3238304 RepID=UPI0035123A6D
MSFTTLNRRMVLLGAASTLGGCTALASLNDAARPLDTYDLSPAAGSDIGRRTSRTLLVARPEASAAIATNRILVRSGPASISYLPDAQWSDELPLVVQSLLIRSISGTGRIGYVGKSDGGPVPDSALLVRLDAFGVVAAPDGTFQTEIDMTLTLLNDSTQRVMATRRFAETSAAADDAALAIVTAFQRGLDRLLPQASDWVLGQV